MPTAPTNRAMASSATASGTRARQKSRARATRAGAGRGQDEAVGEGGAVEVERGGAVDGHLGAVADGSGGEAEGGRGPVGAPEGLVRPRGGALALDQAQRLQRRSVRDGEADAHGDGAVDGADHVGGIDGAGPGTPAAGLDDLAEDDVGAAREHGQCHGPRRLEHRVEAEAELAEAGPSGAAAGRGGTTCVGRAPSNRCCQCWALSGRRASPTARA